MGAGGGGGVDEADSVDNGTQVLRDSQMISNIRPLPLERKEC